MRNTYEGAFRLGRCLNLSLRPRLRRSFILSCFSSRSRSRSRSLVVLLALALGFCLRLRLRLRPLLLLRICLRLRRGLSFLRPLIFLRLVVVPPALINQAAL